MTTCRTSIAGLLIPATLFLSGCSLLRVSQDKSNTPPEHVHQYTNADHLLDATSFEYYYEDGSGLSIAFGEGMLQFEWIVGPRKGNQAKDIPYQSRLIGDELYMVNWHEPRKPDFVSLIINLKQNVLYSSAILRYGTSMEMIHFKEATIKRVKRPAK